MRDRLFLKFSTGIEKFRELAHAAAIELEKRLEHNAIDVQSGSKCDSAFSIAVIVFSCVT